MTTGRIITLSALGFILSACADARLTDSQSATASPEWRQVFVGKSDQLQSGVHLNVELIELFPGESHNEAVMRVLGTHPSVTVAELINGETRPLQRPDQTAATTDVCNDHCNFAQDGVCDEPAYCASGTDCTDCGGQPTSEPDHAFSDAPSSRPETVCFFQGYEGICTPEPECGGRFTEGGCPGGMTCCVAHDAPTSDEPGLGQACGELLNQGICVPGGECSASGVNGTCSAGLECCVEDSVVPKLAATASVALVAWGVEAIIVAYAAWELSRVAQSMIGHIQTSTYDGHTIHLGLSTDPASIDLARTGALPNAAVADETLGVGEVSSDYFETRSVESAGAQTLTCNRQTHQRLNDQKNHNCKHSGPRGCPGGLTCADIQDRISRGSRCVEDRKRLNDVCYGGLGHAGRDGQRTERDEPLENDKRSLQRCQDMYQRACQ